ncbi:MAG: hypothetical protein KUG75_11455 [Pseudomonadales bacterium]|nr:hypothetical protein [Pseudomonadales bacterium]
MPGTDKQTFCAEMSSALAESMSGTADQVDVWLLLEYTPSWSAKANLDNKLDQEVQDWWKDLPDLFQQMGLRARQQFIRQSGPSSPGFRFIVSIPSDPPSMSGNSAKVRARGTESGNLNGGRHSFLFQFEEYEQLLDFDWGLVRDPAAYSDKRITEPNYFVCTNGKRDICCARQGLKTYIELRKSVGKRAWQVTHLGGHRFAPNVLVLPDAVLYGRVHDREVVEFVGRIEAGQLDAERARGRSHLEKVAQAAEIYLPGDLASCSELVSIDKTNQTGQDVVFDCKFQNKEGDFLVTLQRRSSAIQVIASCGDESLKAQYPFELVEITQISQG